MDRKKEREVVMGGLRGRGLGEKNKYKERKKYSESYSNSYSYVLI